MFVSNTICGTENDKMEFNETRNSVTADKCACDYVHINNFPNYTNKHRT